jgi:hypothetical protein
MFRERDKVHSEFSCQLNHSNRSYEAEAPIEKAAHVLGTPTGSIQPEAPLTTEGSP